MSEWGPEDFILLIAAVFLGVYFLMLAYMEMGGCL